MIVKPICGAYDINRKFGFNATEAITIEHEEDFKTRYIDLFLYEGNTRNAVDVSGATVTARMVTTPEFNSLLLNDNVSCSIGEKQGHIIIPIDKAVLPSYPCEFLVEIHIESGENVLVLPFPLWVRMNASILNGAGVTPESKGTVPELLEEATQALEAAEQAIETSKDYDSLNNKPSINGVTIEGNQQADYYGLIDQSNGYTKNQINEMIPIETIKSRNILVGNMEIGKIFSENGRNWDGDGGTRTADYTPIEPLTEYTFSRSNSANAINIFFYDSTETKLSIRGMGVGTANTTFKTPENTAFFRFYSVSDDLSILYQLELGDTATDYQPPDFSETKLQVSENFMAPEVVERLNYRMNDLYVSNSFDSTDTGFGVTKFKTILDANNSITDNSERNRYTIHVADGTYTDLQELYAGVDDSQRPAKDYCGVICKDYVYYEGNVQNPANCVINWDGKTGFAGSITYDNVSKKAPFHLTNIIKNSLHTHVKGFTFNCKNLRYCLHIETSGAGREVDWLIEQCIFNWGGDPDCTDLVGLGSKPAIGAGHSPLERGKFKNCIINAANDVDYLCHDNTNGTTRASGILNGAKIIFVDTNFNDGYLYCQSVKVDSIVQVPYILKFVNCLNLNQNKIIKTRAEGVTEDVWKIETGQISTSKIDIGEAQITIDESTFVYDGNSHVPNVTSVVLNGVQLTYGVDYAVIATPATNAGDYVITVNGIGDYDGTATVNWHINKAQAIINGDESITIRGIGESVTKTYTTNGDGALSFTVSGGVATVTNVGGAVTVTSTEIGSGILTVTVAEGQNYLSAEKTVNITVQEAVTATVFGVMWDYSLSSPELTRLTPQTDPLGVVTTVPTQEPTACIGNDGNGQSDFDNYMPWKGIERYNYINGEIVDFVDYTNGETYVYIPEFWSKIVDDSENSKMYFYVSDKHIDGFTKHLGSGKYIGRYPCDGDFKSTPSGIPRGSTGLDGFRNGIKAIDGNHFAHDIHSASAIQLLILTEFADLNVQEKIGLGITSMSGVQNSGLTDTLTYHTGRASGENNQSAVMYRWIENIWGNIRIFVDGIIASNTNIFICNDVSKYSNAITQYYEDTGISIPNINNEFITKESCYNNGYLFPSEANSSGTATTYTCDKQYYYPGIRAITFGGGYDFLTFAGLFCIHLSDAPTDKPKLAGCRPILILNNGGNE